MAKVSKYVPIRMPREAYENLLIKRRKMEGIIKQITGKDMKVPFTKILNEMSSYPLNLQDDQVVRLGIKRRRK